jgi:hypothetical protein
MTTADQLLAKAPHAPTFDEELATQFAKLLTWFAEDVGSPGFAADVATMGCAPRRLRMMADRWRDPFPGMEPEEAGSVLDEFADAIEAIERENRA